MQLRKSVMVQHQGGMPDNVSMCGLFSVNNALQDRDFLTTEMMRPVLDRLRTTDPGRDHGDPRLGGYTTHALHLALKKRGKQLKFVLGSGSAAVSALYRAGRIEETSACALVIIGRRPGQLAGSWHAIARAKVGDDFKFIDSDDYCFFGNSAKLLVSFFEFIDGVYEIVDVPNKAKKGTQNK
jgi:hypothetical protein